MRKRVLRPLTVYLYDKTGNMAQPWVDAGRLALLVDIQHKQGLHTEDGRVFTLGQDIRNGVSIPDGFPQFSHIEFVAAFPPCDHLAVSGARWFQGKGLRALELSIALFATASEFCEASGAKYMIENPVSTISTYWRKPDHVFQPWWYSAHHVDDNYTKTTCLWTGGGFHMPEQALSQALWTPDDRIHKAPPGPDRKDMRSATPMGFSKAVFKANAS
jgi:hypothetical protein